jgi:hypothetical protein
MQRLEHARFIDATEVSRLFNKQFASTESINAYLADSTLPEEKRLAARTALDILKWSKELEEMEVENKVIPKVNEQRQYKAMQGLVTTFNPVMTPNEKTAAEVGMKADEYHASMPDYTICFNNWQRHAAGLKNNLALKSSVLTGAEVQLFNTSRFAHSGENRYVGTTVFNNVDESMTPEVYLRQVETICAHLSTLNVDQLVEKPNHHWSVVHARAVVNEWKKFEQSV